MKNILTVTLLLVAFTANAGQEAGGGGDSSSRENRQIRSAFKDNAKMLREDLTTIFTNVIKFPPVGTTSSLMHDLIARGILEDIKKAPYVIKTACYDDSGVERSASTQKVNISNDPNAESPEICVNVRKLAMEKASYQSIVGLLAHEHSRHFGEEDTDEFGLHPLADYITEKYRSLTYRYITDAVSLNGVVPIRDDKFFMKILTTQKNLSVNIVIDDLKGECKKLWWKAHSPESLIRGHIKKGDRLSLPENGIIGLILNGFLPFTTFICDIVYRVEVNNQFSVPYKITINSDITPPSASDDWYSIGGNVSPTASRYYTGAHFEIRSVYFTNYNDLEY